ncbi:MAG: CHAT domain-containing protein, partial [Chitinophagales bacterium]|nr:CHAT domain-containing protein [Chitinophagales bacterium]
MIQFHSILLQITADQHAELLDQQERFINKLENKKQLEVSFLDGLRKSMRELLEAQSGVAELIDKAKTEHHLVQLNHSDNNILNLPWRLAVEDIPQLFITKGLPTSSNSEYALQQPLPLKVLVMISAPEDTHARLSYEEEEEQIIRAFEPLFEHGLVQLDFTEDGSLQSLQRKLKENHYHILHFSGHGTYKKEQGFLELEDEITMQKQLVTAEAFAQALNAKPEHLPALVLLSSCQTAQGASGTEFKGVANRLLEIGIPSVVAMGLSISDYFATVFAACLYKELADKEPLYRAFKTAVNLTKKIEKELSPDPNHLPSQWMIPHLYSNGQVEHLADWQAPHTPLEFHNYKFISGQNELLLERHEGYQFLGRRRERKKALQPLLKKQAVLLRGQGGVGKTSMAEHLIQRLALQNGRIHPFVFNEHTASLENVLNALKNYLRQQHKRFIIDAEVEQFSSKAFKQFLYLIQEITKLCDPIFVFDNLESLQEKPGGTFKEVHQDMREVIGFLYENKVFPLLLTGRYSLEDFPDVVDINLNQVSFADFWKKCQQLNIGNLHKQKFHASKKTKQESLQQLVQRLYQSLGGNYRALEFFDQLYQQNSIKAGHTLDTLDSYLEQYKDDVLNQMSENLIFDQLLSLLDEEAKECLGIFYHYRRPVLPMAIDLQETGIRNIDQALQQLVAMTLLEKQQNIRTVRQGALTYYYLTPIVRGMLKQTDFKIAAFSHHKAGNYYYYIVKNVNHHNYNDLEEAYHHYYLAKSKERVNEIGDRLCQFFHDISQFRMSYVYGSKTEQLLQEATNDRVYNNLGLIHNLYGNNNEALHYYKKSLQADKIKGDRKGEGATLNNMATNAYAIGEYEKALEYLEKSLAISQEIGDRQGEGTTLNNISQIYKVRGEYEKALEYLEKSLAIRQEIGDRQGESVTLGN